MPDQIARVVGSGFDTLYWTADIPLLPSLTDQLAKMRVDAQQGDTPSIDLGGMPAVIEPHGTSAGYEFVVSCGGGSATVCTICLTRAKMRPSVMVQMGSLALWAQGHRDAYRLSRYLVARLLDVPDRWIASPNRADFTCDLQGWIPTEDTSLQLVTRARQRVDYSSCRCPHCGEHYVFAAAFCARCGARRERVPGDDDDEAVYIREEPAPPLDRERFWVGRHFTGFRFGSGKTLLVRIYDKTFEIAHKSPDKKWFSTTIWPRNPLYDPGTTVWRIEAQMRRTFMHDLLLAGPGKTVSLDSVEDLFDQADNLWGYVVGRAEPPVLHLPKGVATTKKAGGWIELRDPRGHSPHRPGRWPLHCTWKAVQAATFEANAYPAETARRIHAAAHEEVLRHMVAGCGSTLAANRDLQAQLERDHNRQHYGTEPSDELLLERALELFRVNIDPKDFAKAVKLKRLRRPFSLPSSSGEVSQ